MAEENPIDSKIYILIPVYNEELNIKELKEDIDLKLSSYNLFFVIVDDCSTDKTVLLVKQYFDTNRLKVITKEKNVGPGDSFNLGFEWILENSINDNDLIVTIEGDNTANLDDLVKMIKISNLGFDLVLASVYMQGGKINAQSNSIFRKFLSICANLLLRIVLNLKVLTLTSFFRIYKLSVIKNIKKTFPEIIFQKGFICKVEILIKAIELNARIIEVPTTLLSDKRKGKSKMKILKNIFEYLKLIFSHYVRK